MDFLSILVAYSGVLDEEAFIPSFLVSGSITFTKPWVIDKVSILIFDILKSLLPVNFSISTLDDAVLGSDQKTLSSETNCSNKLVFKLKKTDHCPRSLWSNKFKLHKYKIKHIKSLSIHQQESINKLLDKLLLIQ